MSDDHLTPEALRRLLGKDNDEEQNRLLLHHLEVCPECREVGGWVADLYRSGRIGLQFSSVDVDLGRSRVEAESLWEELRSLPSEEREAVVLGADRFKTWGMAELLCRESLAVAGRAPRSHGRPDPLPQGRRAGKGHPRPGREARHLSPQGAQRAGAQV